MKKKVYYAIVLVAALTVTGLYVMAKGPQQNEPALLQKQVDYTCPMHPDVIQDEPGNCPKCGMKLVEMKGTSQNSSQGSPHTGHDQSMQDSTSHMMNDSTRMNMEHKMH